MYSEVNYDVDGNEVPRNLMSTPEVLKTVRIVKQAKRREIIDQSESYRSFVQVVHAAAQSQLERLTPEELAEALLFG